MKRSLDWRNLQFFLAVARSGSLSEAGRLLGVDHATVGRHIVSLESSVGKTLFERHLRGYALTRYGQDLLTTAEAMDREATLVAQATSPAFGLTGIVRINALEGFANFFLASRIGPLLADNPALTVEILTIQQIVALSRRQADIAITVTPSDDDRFVCEKLTPYHLCVYATRAYLEREKTIKKPDDFSSHLFAGYVDEMIFMRELDYLGDLGVSRKMVRIQNSSVQAQMEAACSGLCMAVLPTFVAATRPELVPVLPQQIRLERHYWLITRADEQKTPRVDRVCDFIREEVVKSGAQFAR
ncbi:LysR family transcriptional regulator [Acetobacter indonesiensis NRIC 0313]|uniref:LysR family transcriptional regulator n=1 Tax=Acetobacter indonesiensis TaxID=104101 RepID=A0A252AT17_9PROT|nr:LysR family transcriptional regulator [Acetobacter indonesiensis]MCG0995995.1 LysR family transcriptional regulator [Acetobacter indonesiensis]MCP1230875.1 LysR family transcriptional regulator [Acetobacter indonesiensis]OUI93189.1 LysR family transcriptional regulator [Acetobacter indonesiensis]OUI93692.1 LysR family transcriptional regulator [Acetobacter indonesiensis]GAN63045.1 transcriptional regulator LysR [Acetobacter indonesiensis]